LPAFFARWIVTRFPNKFEGERANTKLLDKLTTESEMSGLLYLALSGLKRLLDNNKFSYNNTSEDVAEEYQRLSNPVSAVINDCLETEPEEYC
jgi:putative DNA primase/helicase